MFAVETMVAKSNTQAPLIPNDDGDGDERDKGGGRRGRGKRLGGSGGKRYGRSPTLTVAISDAMRAELDELADERDVLVSELVREAVARYLAEARAQGNDESK